MPGWDSLPARHHWRTGKNRYKDRQSDQCRSPERHVAQFAVRKRRLQKAPSRKPKAAMTWKCALKDLPFPTSVITSIPLYFRREVTSVVIHTCNSLESRTRSVPWPAKSFSSLFSFVLLCSLQQQDQSPRALKVLC